MITWPHGFDAQGGGTSEQEACREQSTHLVVSWKQEGRREPGT